MQYLAKNRQQRQQCLTHKQLTLMSQIFSVIQNIWCFQFGLIQDKWVLESEFLIIKLICYWIRFTITFSDVSVSKLSNFCMHEVWLTGYLAILVIYSNYISQYLINCNFSNKYRNKWVAVHLPKMSQTSILVNLFL